MRILQVEDEAISALQMELALKRLGHEVLPHVATGEAAIARAERDNPDLVLMDIRLAGEMDGIQAAAAIRSVSAVPIVFITGYDDAEIRDRASGVGPLAYLIKPNVIVKLKIVLDAYRPAPGEGDAAPR